jgi:His/Glu/Gln/Arg/opine family amino acid ABC transporter permease subunit
MRPDTWPMFLDPAIWRFFGEGLWQTVTLSVASVAVSFVVGLIFALGRLSSRRWIRWPATAYVEALRAVPVLLLIVYFGIKGSSLFRPIFGPEFELPRFWAGVLGLSLYTSAVLAEIIFVVLPQALRLMVPAMMGQLTTVIKDTSLVGTIGVFDLLRQGRTIYTQFFNPVEVLLIVAAIYFVICFVLSQVSRRLELDRVPREARIRMTELELRDQAA